MSTKKMRELQDEIQKKVDAALDMTTRDDMDADAVNALLDEAAAMKKQLDALTRVQELNRTAVHEATKDMPVARKAETDGFAIMKKLLSGAALTEAQKSALITGEDAENGENYLIPEDVRLEINELRRSYRSAKDIVSVTPTTALSGSTNYEDGTPTGLVAFDDGDTIPEESSLKFVKKPFTIAWYGKIVPISNILIGAEKAGLMRYLNRWFIKNAIITENARIFAKLKEGYGTPKAVKGWKALKSSINKDLDPDALIDGVIVTNQTGFDILDSALDENGRPILQPDPSEPTRMLFRGIPVTVFADTQLTNIAVGKAPIFYGNTRAGCEFVEYENLMIAYSEHFGFGKNQNYMRVIEGFDVMSTDTGAYIYGALEAEPLEAEPAASGS